MEADRGLSPLPVVSICVKRGFEVIVGDALSKLVRRGRLEADSLIFDVYRPADDPARLLLHEVCHKNSTLLEKNRPGCGLCPDEAQLSHESPKPRSVPQLVPGTRALWPATARFGAF